MALRSFACPTSHSDGRNFLACFAVKYNYKGNTKLFARPTGILRAGKDLKEIITCFTILLMS